jgi:hypothetical protein
MAQRIMLIDDLDGSEAAETVRFSIGDIEYEIDLSDKNVGEFNKALAPYLEKSRVVDRTPPLAIISGRSRRARGAGRRQRDDLPEIRAWAKSKGLKVSDRGRVKAEIIEQYDREHS